MKVVCKVSHINTLTYLKVYEVVNEGAGGYIIIDDFENNKNHIKLSTDHGVERISSYEIDIRYLSEPIKKLISDKIESIIKPMTGGKVGMVFGVRYSLDTKSYMSAHYDCNTYSCVISLNDDFHGGGTYFPLNGEIVKPEIGYGCLFICIWLV